MNEFCCCFGSWRANLGRRDLVFSFCTYLLDCVYSCSTSVFIRMKCILPNLVLGNPKHLYFISVDPYRYLFSDNLCCCIHSNLALVCVCVHLLSMYQDYDAVVNSD